MKDQSPAKNFFWDICGHEKNLDFLQLSLSRQQLSHAYLFVGPGHLGKRLVADKFVASLFCQSAGPSLPCGQCQPCQQFTKGLHPDFLVLERELDESADKLKKNISVEQIRAMKNRLQQGTLLDGFKVALIPEAQHINQNSANALLKVLEEPTVKTILILIADDLQVLPPTLISRCQVLKFLPVASQKIQDYLTLKGALQRAKVLAKLAHGRPGIAISFFSDPGLLDEYLSNINYFWQLWDQDIFVRLSVVDKLIAGHGDEAISDDKLTDLLAAWQDILRDLLLINSGADELVANLDFNSQLAKKQGDFSNQKIRLIVGQIQLAKMYLKQNVNPRLVLENLTINL